MFTIKNSPICLHRKNNKEELTSYTVVIDTLNTLFKKVIKIVCPQG